MQLEPYKEIDMLFRQLDLEQKWTQIDQVDDPVVVADSEGIFDAEPS